MIKGHITMTVYPDYARREIVERLIKNGEVIVRLKDIGDDGVLGFELLPDIVYCLDDFCSKGERL